MKTAKNTTSGSKLSSTIYGEMAEGVAMRRPGIDV